MAKSDWTRVAFVSVEIDIDATGQIVEGRQGLAPDHQLVVAAEDVLGGGIEYLWVLVDPEGTRAPRLELGGPTGHLAWTVGAAHRRAVPTQAQHAASAARDGLFALLHRRVEQLGGPDAAEAALKAAGLGDIASGPSGGTRWYETADSLAADGRRTGLGRIVRALFGPEPKEAAEAETVGAWTRYHTYREVCEPWTCPPIPGEEGFVAMCARVLRPLRDAKAAYVAAADAASARDDRGDRR